MQHNKINEIFAYLRELFGPAPACELNFTTDIELLVAIILSAQCTDKRVNAVTEKLFTKYKNVRDFANANNAELENEVRSTGFHRNKAANIINSARIIVEKYNGKIPVNIEELRGLPGVGRKSASVFLSVFHKIPALAVDTHVTRTAKRLGLSNGKNPLAIERDLSTQFDKENWSDYHLYLVLFGRYNCKAKKPLCETCKIKKLCYNNSCLLIKSK